MAFYEDKSISHGNLLLNPLGKLLTEKVTIAKMAVETALTAGYLMGKISRGALAAAAPVAASAGEAGANTGTGTVVLDATTPLLDGVKVGTYTFKCISAATAEPAADAVFEVYDPEGSYMGKTDAGTGGDTWAKHLKFVITDKATAGDEVAFAAGDGFAITVAYGVNANAGKLGVFDPSKADGTEEIYGILGNDVTVGTAADATGSFVYLKGLFDENEIGAIDGVDPADYKDELRALGIFLSDVATE